MYLFIYIDSQNSMECYHFVVQKTVFDNYSIHTFIKLTFFLLLVKRAS